MQAKKFKNFTASDFTWKFDGIPYTFVAGTETYLEDYKADHFAKHLIDRELTARGIPTNMTSERDALAALCFPSDEVLTPLEAMNVNEKTKVKKGKKEEVEFEELTDK